MDIRFRAACAIVALAACSAHAAPACSVAEGKSLIYRLDLTVPATFCSGGGAAHDPSCDEFPKQAAIQLHGLWPNYQGGGYPAGSCDAAECQLQPPLNGKYCAYPEPPSLYTSPWWKGLAGYMAGVEKCLERHEWIKHGTCSGMSAPDYFQWSLQETARIVERLKLPEDTPISRQELDGWVKQRLPEYNGAFRLTCRGEQLSGLYLIFEWGNPPGKAVKNKGGRNHFGNCKQTFFLPTKPN